MKSVQNYTIGKTHTVINLNKDAVNFDLYFKVTSLSNKKFKTIVVEQNELNNISDDSFKIADGVISGNISMNENIFKEFFIVIASDEEQEVEITLELSPFITDEPPKNDDTQYNLKNITKNNNKYYLYIGLGILSIVASYYLYKYFNKNESTTNIDTISTDASPSTTVQTLSPDVIPIQQPTTIPIQQPTTIPIQQPTITNDILNKLNNLPEIVI